jgi:hypothetical protein
VEHAAGSRCSETKHRTSLISAQAVGREGSCSRCSAPPLHKTDRRCDDAG